MATRQPTWIDPFTDSDYERVDVELYENTDPTHADAPRFKLVAPDLRPPLVAFGNDYETLVRNFRQTMAVWRQAKDRRPDA